MNKVNALITLVIVLVLLNFGVLCWLIFSPSHSAKKPPHHFRPEPKHMIINQLGFDEKQIQAYEELIQDHRKGIGSQEKIRRQLKNELYQLLLTHNNSTKDSLMIELAQVQKNIEVIHFNHFKDIQALCTHEQQAAFEELTQELQKMFSHKHPPPKHHQH